MSLKIEIKVMPASGKSGCIIDKNQRLRCYVKAQAEDGKANKELIKQLAEICHVTQKDVDIISGLTCRNKIILINTTINYDQFLHMIGFAQQKKLF
jgi:uncharacterized protein (TIGR00251 family)